MKAPPNALQLLRSLRSTSARGSFVSIAARRPLGVTLLAASTFWGIVVGAPPITNTNRPAQPVVQSPAGTTSTSPSTAASPDLRQLQPFIDSGKAAVAMARIEQALESKPTDARLHYNLGVAAYAAGEFDKALIAFDNAEAHGNRKVSRIALFQKGNTEFRLGAAARESNLEDTIARWKVSLNTYRDVLVETADHTEAGHNFHVVRRALLELLLEDAKKHMEKAQQPRQSPMQQLENLRNAFQKYSEAKEVDPDSEEASEGEQESREQLAQALAQQGQKLASQPFRQRPNPREPSLPDLDVSQLEEGVGMLRDANELKPEDEAIAKALDFARNRLADADVIKARSYMALEERIGWVREKLALLRMAREIVEEGLNEVPDHQLAQDTREAINDRLADIHEDEGDQLSQEAQMSRNNLEQKAMQLSQALDHFQQSNELQPENEGLPPKIEQTEESLADALDQLADQLMQGQQPNESLEGQIARLEGAEQALNQLQGMRPSQRTSERAEQVGAQLDGLRQAMAQQGQQPGEEGQNGPPRPGRNPGGQLSQFGIPMDSRPRINTPGMKGEWNSRMMNSAKDY